MTTSIIDKIKNYNPDFWKNAPNKIFVLEQLINRFPEGGSITETKLKSIYRTLKKNKKLFPSINAQEITVRKVLTYTNEMGFTQADIPVKRLRVPRASIIPADAEEFELLTTIEKMRHFIWEKWLRSSNRNKDDLLFALMANLMTDAGITDPALTWILNNLRYEHIWSAGRLVIPVDSDDLEKGHVHIYLPVTCELLLKSVRDRFCQSSENDFVLLPHKEGAKTRRKAIHKFWKHHYKSFCATYKLLSSETLFPNESQFKRAGRLIAILRHDLEPCISTISSQIPLPTAHPSHHKQPLIRDDYSITVPSDALREIVTSKDSCLQQMQAENGLYDDEIEYLKRTNLKYKYWRSRSRNIVRCLNRELREITDNRLSTEGRVKKAHDYIDELLLEADELAPQKSALHLALLWAKNLIQTTNMSNNPKANTIANYLSRIFTARLLRDPDSYDLSLWEPEDHETLAEQHILDEKLKGKTRQEIATTYSRVYQFAADHGFCEHVNIRWIANEIFQGSRRARLIDPSDFNVYLNCYNENDRHSLLIKVATMLGYYTGLRANEMNKLTLDDILLYDDECYIEIQGGKSPAARRRISLHLLAPTEVIQCLTKWWNQRRAEFSEDARMDKIYLFGPLKRRERYTRNNLTNVIIRQLKTYFKDNNMVFHSLRHNFASWNFLRWYALRYPEVLKPIIDRKDAFFSHDSLENFALLFSLVPGELSDPARPNDLVVLSKLQGHLGQQTLFQHYVHTFHIVHKHSMQRISENLDHGLTWDVVANLVKGMKNRASQSALKQRTICGLLEYLDCKHKLQQYKISIH